MTAGTVASHRIAAQLRDDILTGALQPGERIRQEDIAAQFEASRAPVREALRIVEAQGLIQLRANSGAWVAKLDLAECQTIYKMRERLEPLALAESVVNLTDADVQQIADLQQQMEENTDLDRFLALDREMHLMCYAGSRLIELNRIVERFWNTTQAYRRAFVHLSGPERTWVVNAEHRLLVDAIQRRDADDGERILVSHIRRTRESLAAHPSLFDGGPLQP